MAFAFFWLVCGELITLHQKAIYGFDPFSQETPYAKTDNSSSKSKTDKSSKFDKFKDQYHFDLVLKEKFKFNYLPQFVDFKFANTFTIFLSQSGYPLIALRAPPTS
jgi:hypothetical protein